MKKRFFDPGYAVFNRGFNGDDKRSSSAAIGARVRLSAGLSPAAQNDIDWNGRRLMTQTTPIKPAFSARVVTGNA